jgi:hypothetical protein
VPLIRSPECTKNVHTGKAESSSFLVAMVELERSPAAWDSESLKSLLGEQGREYAHAAIVKSAPFGSICTPAQVRRARGSRHARGAGHPKVATVQEGTR